MDTDIKLSQQTAIGEIETNLEYADSSTVGITKDNSPRPKNVRLPLVTPEEEEAERPRRN